MTKICVLLKIATIIVTYNAQKWIERCLVSAKQSNYPSDVFIVDNASTDNTLEIVNQKSGCEVIALKKNFGFGYANNIALKKALSLNYDYYFLINQDVYLEATTLTELVDFAKKNADFGIVCPTQYNGNGSEVDFLFQNYLKKTKENATYFEADFVNAAAWLVSKNCVKKIGFFNKLFKHYGEDNDYCNRVKFHGLKIGIVKNTKVLHDRDQKQSLEKAIALARIKLLIHFVNPNLSAFKSILTAFISVLGISKYLVKKYKTRSAFTSFLILTKEYLRLLFNFSALNRQKNESKKINY